MYKIIIVDDERPIREGIARGNAWTDWGFTVSAVCKNGTEAIQRIEKERPDVILSDIRMPGMDGIELMKYVREHYPDIKMVILSGYKDFEYLNMSIRHQVKEYLLKPTDPDEFAELFQKLKGELDEEHRKDEIFQKYRMEKNLAAILQKYGEVQDKQALKQEVEKHYGVHLDNCRLILCRLDKRHSYTSEAFHALRQETIRICNTVVTDVERYFWLYKEELLTGIVSRHQGEPDKNTTEAFLAEIQKTAEAELGISISAGVSEQCASVEEIPDRMQQTEHCVRQRIFQGYGRIFFYEQLEEQGEDMQDAVFDYQSLEQSLLAEDAERVQQCLRSVLGRFQGIFIRDTDYFYNLCMELYFCLFRIAGKFDLDFDMILADCSFSSEQIQHPDCLDEVICMYTELAMRVGGSVQKVIAARREINSTPELLKGYVDEEYANNRISLEYLSEKTGKSPAYISRIFKEEAGCGFSEYVTKRRLEKSRELLQDPKLRVYEIAEQIGYADVSNYIRLFKKWYGMSPKDFRNCTGRKSDDTR